MPGIYGFYPVVPEISEKILLMDLFLFNSQGIFERSRNRKN